MSAPTDGTPPEWLPVPEAAAAAGVPVRSLYRWTEKKRVPTRTENGTTLVELSAVIAYSARRMAMKTPRIVAGNAGTGAGTNAVNGAAIRGDSGTGTTRGIEGAEASGTPPVATKTMPPAGNRATPATSSGATLAAEVFTAFEEGANPVDVVREMHLLPEQVRALHREWMELRTIGGGGGPSIADRLAEVEKRMKEMAETLPLEVAGVEISANHSIWRLEGRIERLESQLAGLLSSIQNWNHGHRR